MLGRCETNASAGLTTFSRRPFTMTDLVVVGLLLTIWLLSVQLSDADSGGPKSGPYKVEIEKITECEDEGTREVVFGTKIYKTSDGRYMYNNPIYLGYPIDQDFKIHAELQSFSNGGYRPRFMHYTFKGCQEQWKYFEDFYKHLMQSAGGTIEKCPFPAGNYTIKDFDVNIINVNNVPAMIYNRYRSVVKYLYRDKKVGCTNVYANVIPK